MLRKLIFMFALLGANSSCNVFSHSQAEAYFFVFLNAVGNWNVPNNDKIKTIAIDLSKMKLQDNRDFISLVEEYCAEHKITLIFDTWKGSNSYIRGGIFIVFKDEKLTEDELITNVDTWVAPMASSGMMYIVEKLNDIWEIKRRSLNWMS